MDERGRIRGAVSEPLRTLSRTGAATTLLLLATLPAWAVGAGSVSASLSRDSSQLGQGHERFLSNPPGGIDIDQVIEDCRTGLRIKVRFPDRDPNQEGIAKPAAFETLDVRAFDYTYRGISEGEEGQMVFYPGEGQPPTDKLELAGRSNRAGGIDVGIHHLETNKSSVEQIPCGDPDYELIYLVPDPGTVKPALPVGRISQNLTPGAAAIQAQTRVVSPTITPTLTRTATATPSPSSSPSAFDTLSRQISTVDTRVGKIDGEVGELKYGMGEVRAAATGEAVIHATMQEDNRRLRGELQEAKRYAYINTGGLILAAVIVGGVLAYRRWRR